MLRPTKTRLLATAAGGCLAAALAACSSTTASGTSSAPEPSSTSTEATASASHRPLKLAFFAVDANNTYSQATLEGIKEVADDAGATVTVFDGKFDVPTQLSQIESAITAGDFDGLIIHPVDGNSLVGAVTDAIAAGVSVGTTNGPIGPAWDTTQAQVPGLAASVFTPAPTVGKTLADLTVDACGSADPCNVAYLMGSAKYGLDTNQKIGFDAEIAKHPEIDVVTTLEGQYSADGAYTAVQNALQAHPDLTVITTNSDGMAQGAEKAIKAAGSSAKLIGNGGSQIAADGIKAGTWYGSSILLPKTEGELVAKGVIQDAEGGGPTQGQDATAQSPVGLFLTAQTLPNFTPEWNG